ncbi:sulfite exporter TauE/SafE family protein [Nibribacter koreensis]|uniref:sulfite exporter TauE/SafE family protein n=1 Tax=Nibribacter koreensis TaxID=1084519 RepID=UPI0031F0AA2E
MVTEILLFVIGVLVSAFGTLIGFGGGVFLVPILIIFFQFPIEVAIGSAMCALLPASLITSIFSYREKNIDYVVASLIQPFAMLGTVLGAFLVAYIPVLHMQALFALFVSGTGVYMLVSHVQAKARKQGVLYRINRLPTSFIRKNRPKHKAYRLNGTLVSFFGLCTGTMAGMFGIGGGFLQTPIMIKVFKIPPQIAISTSLFLLVITSLTGISSHYWLGNVDWVKSAPLMLAFAIGAVLGKILKQKSHLHHPERLIGLGLLLAGASVITHIFLKYEFDW